MTHRSALQTPTRAAGTSPGSQGEARTRSTQRKRALHAVLDSADGFLSVAELHDRLRARLAGRGLRVGLTTVYNQVRALAETGEVDVLRSDDGTARYRLRRQDGHHHYLLCRACGQAIEIVSGPVEAWADTLADAFGFCQVTHNVELVGLCGRCHHRPCDVAADRA